MAHKSLAQGVSSAKNNRIAFMPYRCHGELLCWATTQNAQTIPYQIGLHLYPRQTQSY
jgi:hypothetical protein